MADSAVQIGERFMAAIMAGDIDTVRSLYHPEAKVWHNFDQVSQTVDENMRVLSWMTRRVKELRYDEVRRVETPEGFAQQHVLRGVAPNGEKLEDPAAIFCTIEDGLITRLEEYLDSAQTAVLTR
jgi:ketosteroid isomerase-like protein